MLQARRANDPGATQHHQAWIVANISGIMSMKVSDLPITYVKGRDKDISRTDFL